MPTLDNTPASSTLAPPARLALESALGEIGMQRGFGWVKTAVLVPFEVARLSELTDGQVIAALAGAIAPWHQSGATA